MANEFEQEGNVEYAQVQNEIVDINDEIGGLAQLLEDNKSGFRAACKVLQERADVLAQEVIGTPCKTMDEVLGQEYKKGLLQGLLQFEIMLSTRLQLLREEKQRLSAQLDEMRGTDHG